MINDLFALVPPPRHPVAVANDDDWARAEAVLAFAFPADFKAINGAYGEGWFNDFFYVFGAARAAKKGPIHEYTSDREAIFAGWRAFSPSTAPDPGRCRLIPIMNTSNGDEVFYLLDRETGRLEISVHASRSSVGTRYTPEFSTLFAGLLSGTIRDEAFPVPTAEPSFNPA